jgi:hypothetical protein
MITYVANTVQGALEWLEQNQDKSLEEINAPPQKQTTLQQNHQL